jgi:GABA permease
MRRYLVVANRTLGGDHLLEALRERIAQGPSAFHVLVPASHATSGAVWTEGEAAAHAQEQLDQALVRFGSLGAEVTGEVGDASPVRAVGDALLGGAFDEVILSTLPPGPSRWLKQDVIHRLERSVDVPVTHVVGAAESATTT